MTGWHHSFGRSLRRLTILIILCSFSAVFSTSVVVASPWYPAHGFFSDPWNTQSNIPPLGAYSTDRHGLAHLRPPVQPSLSKLEQLRSLPALTRWALQHNPQTATAWAALQARAAALGLAKSLWLPTLSGHMGVQRSDTTYGRGFGAPPLTGLYSTLSLSEVLFNFGYRSASVHKAQIAMMVARYDADATIQQVVLAIAEAYYSLAEARQEVMIYRQGVREANLIYQAARLQYRAHLKPITDVYQAQTALALARGNLSAARGIEHASRGALAEAAGLPVTVPLTIFSLPQPPGMLPSSIKHWLHQSLAHNPTILAELARMREARQSIAQAEAQGLPSVSLVGNLGDNQLQYAPNGRSFSAGIQIDVPLDSNFSSTYQVQQDRALYRETRAQAQQAANNTLLKVWQAYYQWHGAKRSYAAAAEQVASAQKALAGIRTEYRIGLANILDLITAEGNLIQSRITKVQTLTQYYQYQAILFRGAGMVPDTAKK